MTKTLIRLEVLTTVVF